MTDWPFGDLKRGHCKYDIAAWIGKTFNGQKIISRGANRKGAAFWLVECACGNRREIAAAAFMRGKSRMCVLCQKKSQTGCGHPHWRGGVHVPLTHFNKFRRSAARRGIEWKLAIGDIDALYEKQRGLCALTETPLAFDHGERNGVANGNASLDRIDYRIGYIAENVQLVTKYVNIAKQRLNNEEFREVCIAVVNACL